MLVTPSLVTLSYHVGDTVALSQSAYHVGGKNVRLSHCIPCGYTYRLPQTVIYQLVTPSLVTLSYHVGDTVACHTVISCWWHRRLSHCHTMLVAPLLVTLSYHVGGSVACHTVIPLLREVEGQEAKHKHPGLFSASVSQSLSQVIGGFLLVVTSTGKVAYVAEAIEHFFGHTQVDLLGNSIYNVIHPEDRHIMEEQLSSTGAVTKLPVLLSLSILLTVFSSSKGQGIVSYRLRCKDGTHVTLRSRGYIEVNQTGQVETFVCINTVVSTKEAKDEIKNQRRNLLPLIISEGGEDHLSSVSSSIPSELIAVLKERMNPENIQKIIDSIDPDLNIKSSIDTMASQDTSFSPKITPGRIIESFSTQVVTNIEDVQLTDNRKGCSNSKNIVPQNEIQKSQTVAEDITWLQVARKRGSDEDLCNVPLKKLSSEPVSTPARCQSANTSHSTQVIIDHDLNFDYTSSSLFTSLVHDQCSIQPIHNTLQENITDLSLPVDIETKVSGSMMDTQTQPNIVSTCNANYDLQVEYNSEISSTIPQQFRNFATESTDSYQPFNTGIMTNANDSSMNCSNNIQINDRNYRYEGVPSEFNNQRSSPLNKSTNLIQHQNGNEIVSSSNQDLPMIGQSQVYSQSVISPEHLTQHPDEYHLLYNQKLVPLQKNICSDQMNNLQSSQLVEVGGNIPRQQQERPHMKECHHHQPSPYHQYQNKVQKPNDQQNQKPYQSHQLHECNLQQQHHLQQMQHIHEQCEHQEQQHDFFPHQGQQHCEQCHQKQLHEKVFHQRQQQQELYQQQRQQPCDDQYLQQDHKQHEQYYQHKQHEQMLLQGLQQQPLQQGHQLQCEPHLQERQEQQHLQQKQKQHEHYLQQRQEQQCLHQVQQQNFESNVHYEENYHQQQTEQHLQLKHHPDQWQRDCHLNQTPEIRKSFKGPPVIFTHCSTSSVTQQDEDNQVCEGSSVTVLDNNFFSQYGVNFQPQISDQLSGTSSNVF
nr:serine/threonine-protein kinase pakD-like [Cherax quadricarinatus]